MAKKRSKVVTENDFIRAMSVFNDAENQQYFSDDVQELVRRISGLSEDGISEEEAEDFLAAAKRLKTAAKNYSGDLQGAAAVVLAFAEKRIAGAEQTTGLDDRIIDLETENAFISRDRDQLEAELTEANIANAEISAAYEALLHPAVRIEPDLNSIEEAKKANKNYINLKRVFETETEKRRRAEGHIRAAKSEAANAKRDAALAKAVARKAAAEVVATKKENKFRGKVIVVTSLLVLASVLTTIFGVGSIHKKANKIQSEYDRYRAAYTLTVDEKTNLEDNISDLNNAIIIKDEDISDLNNTIVVKDKDIAGLNDTIADKDKEIADKNQTIDDNNAEISNLANEIKDLKTENKALKDELDSYKNPKSNEADVPSLEGAETLNSFAVSGNGVIFSVENGQITKASVQGENDVTMTVDVVNNQVSPESIANEVSSIVGVTVSSEDENVSKLTSSINTALADIIAKKQAQGGADHPGKTDARSGYAGGPSL